MSSWSEVHRLVKIGVDDRKMSFQDADVTYLSVVISVMSQLCAFLHDRMRVLYNHHISFVRETLPDNLAHALHFGSSTNDLISCARPLHVHPPILHASSSRKSRMTS